MTKFRDSSKSSIMVSIPRHQRDVIDDLTILMDKAVKFQCTSNPHQSLGYYL